MSGNRAESICSDLKFTSNTPPIFKDILFEVWQVINEWNHQIKIFFILYCISWLDESIYVWINKFTFPEILFCSSKTHPKANEYHDIYFFESGIMYGWDIVKGRYHKIPMGGPEFDTSSNMKMVGLMIWLTRALWSTGNAVIMDSCFCVFRGILETRKRRVYGSALIKKMCCWTRVAHEDKIDEYFSTNNIGDVGCLSGEWDETD